MQLRKWEAGRKAFFSLPLWLRIVLTPLYYWLEILIVRPRMVAAIALVLGGFLLLEKFWVDVDDARLTWMNILLLSTGHIWITLFIVLSFYPLYLPIVILVWCLVGFDAVPTTSADEESLLEPTEEHDDLHFEEELEGENEH